MKALFFKEHGDSSKLQFGDIPYPNIQNNEVIVRVRACALNHLDLWVLGGWPGLKLEMPHVGGADVAGEVVEIGANVKGFSVGDRVAICPGIITRDDEFTARGEESLSPGYRIIGESTKGGFAEYIKVPGRNLIHIPDSFGYSYAAAPLLVGVTAWRMLIHRAGLTARESVLIVGAGGGLNSFTIQLAKILGARVYALTSNDDKEKKALELGADAVINYKKTTDWPKAVLELTHGRGVDVVVDNVGAATINNSIRAAARGGRIVTVGNTSGPELKIDNRFLFTKQISLIGSTMGSLVDFKNAMNLVWNGQIKPVVDCEIPLAKGKDAYDLLKSGSQFGKIVLVP
jgi:NADPH:quinone reductase-like Zn-dependent oxidoreductase